MNKLKIVIILLGVCLMYNEYRHRKIEQAYRVIVYQQESNFYQAVTEAWNGIRIIHQMKTKEAAN